jgi:hypothetical protein
MAFANPDRPGVRANCSIILTVASAQMQSSPIAIIHMFREHLLSDDLDLRTSHPLG